MKVRASVNADLVRNLIRREMADARQHFEPIRA